MRSAKEPHQRTFTGQIKDTLTSHVLAAIVRSIAEERSDSGGEEPTLERKIETRANKTRLVTR
jgi:hypothetical protein